MSCSGGTEQAVTLTCEIEEAGLYTVGSRSTAVAHIADMFWCMVQMAENAMEQKMGMGGAGGAGAQGAGAGAPATGAGQAGQGRSPVFSPLLLILPVLVEWSFSEVANVPDRVVYRPSAPVVLSSKR